MCKNYLEEEKIFKKQNISKSIHKNILVEKLIFCYKIFCKKIKFSYQDKRSIKIKTFEIRYFCTHYVHIKYTRLLTNV